MKLERSLNTVGARIRECRKARNYTQDQLANIMCIPKSTISSYENDKVDIKGSVIVEIAKILNTTPNYLLLGERNKAVDSFVETMIALLSNIKNDKTKELLLAQMKAVSSIC